jgi:hypothetical protein
MANPDLAVDTSIVIDYFRKRNKQKSILFQIVDDFTLYWRRPSPWAAAEGGRERGRG